MPQLRLRVTTAFRAIDAWVKAITYYQVSAFPGHTEHRMHAYWRSRRMFDVLIGALAPALNLAVESVEIAVSGAETAAGYPIGASSLGSALRGAGTGPSQRAALPDVMRQVVRELERVPSVATMEEKDLPSLVASHKTSSVQAHLVDFACSLRQAHDKMLGIEHTEKMVGSSYLGCTARPPPRSVGLVVAPAQ
uniref:hypothetical protein n=1 Tax=Rhodococcus qingshengii TaxID=334542 RepID=UPI001C4DFECE|nr:hypothetical protein [Rhodococcus qingshengii]